MSWAKVDDQWFTHRKVVGLDLAARGLWVTVLSWSCSHRSPHIPDHMIRFLTMGADVADLTAQLVETGLWHKPGHSCADCEEINDGFVIHNWVEYQEKTTREKRAEAGRKGGKASGEARRKQAEATPKQTEAPSEARAEAGARPVPTRPDQETPSATSADADDRREHDHAEVDRQFNEHFWPAYPARNGKKVGKRNALIEWRKLTIDQRRRALIGARNLAASDQLPKDPERFLRRSKGGKGDYPFDDWQTPARASPRSSTLPPEPSEADRYDPTAWT